MKRMRAISLLLLVCALAGCAHRGATPALRYSTPPEPRIASCWSAAWCDAEGFCLQMVATPNGDALVPCGLAKLAAHPREKRK